MNKPIRILHVLGGLDRGGAETMIMNLYRKIDRNKIQFDFVIHHVRKQSYKEEIMKLGGKIYYISPYTGKNHLKYVKEWNAFFENHPECEIIHGHVRSTASIYLKIAKKYERTTIAHSHNTSNGKGSSALIKRILQLPIKNIADYLFAPTIEAGEWLFGKKAIISHKFYVFKNAIDTKEYMFNHNIRNYKRKELGINNEKVIGHVGRFDEQKNHRFLLEIFFQFHKLNPNTLLMLVGKGPLEEEIKQRVDDLKLKNKVRFLGERSDINELMQTMDVFVFPSFYEGLGIVAIEAQASGLPVIASNVIPKEVKVTELLNFVNLKSTSLEWAMKINEKLKIKRDITDLDIIAAGYDINATVNWLSEFYLTAK